uniref:Ubiquitin-associated protein 2-like n=1 Tax=Saccoglossus kowalevskii TaxID=10224 RepID=A0ABM0LVL4_SACKO|nr:PREDICTED: ubiquitin-associated protein 2-like [Saccoglossus kowalevskii]
MAGSAYGNKAHAQSFDKQGFHAGTPPPFNIPLASGAQGGTMNPATGYAATPAPFVQMMAPHPHQHQHQHHSQMLAHQMHGDGPQGGSNQRSQGGSSQGKPTGSKQSYSSPYWGAS